MEHLLVIDYETDAERKRIDSTIDRWRSKLDIHREKGVVIRFSGNRIDEFLRDLYARLDKGGDNVRIYASEAITPQVEEISENLSYITDIDATSLEKFLRFLLNKMNAGYEGRTEGGESFSAYTRKGRASITTRIQERNGERQVFINITGFGAVVQFVSKRIDDDLRAFLEGSG